MPEVKLKEKKSMEMIICGTKTERKFKKYMGDKRVEKYVTGKCLNCEELQKKSEIVLGCKT